MKIIFLLFILIHALIHLMGFFKAFNLAEIKELTGVISKPYGIVWLCGAVFFAITAILYMMNNQYWWIAALLSVLLSQFLVIVFWGDARFGTIMNIAVLIVAVISFAQWNFSREIQAETKKIVSQSSASDTVITEDMFKQLPEPVKNWLQNSGIVGKKTASLVFLKQKALMKMNPDAKKWTPALAQQHFTVDPPSFIWQVSLQMMPLITVAGRDLFKDGKGSMIIKILSLISAVNAQGPKIDEGTMQRYLGEIVWFPSAALSKYITWKELDHRSAQATMSYNGTTVKGTFRFNEKSEFQKYTAMRYMGNDKDAAQKQWVITADETGTFNGIRVPVKMHATWKLEKGDWTWLKLEITKIKYD